MHSLSNHRFFHALMLVLLLGPGLQSGTHAASPVDLNYQGYLTDPSGAPENGSVNVTFALYNVSSGGVPLWSDTLAITVSNGLFSVPLGRPGNAFPPGLFDNPVWIGINAEGDGEMTPRRPMTSVGFAFHADDADSLQGFSATALDQTAHVSDLGNPHAVSWNELSGIPADILDGDDNSGGDITRVVAGFGLAGGGLSGDVVLSANASILQRRVVGVCSAGQTMVAVNIDGSVECVVDATAATLCSATKLLDGSGSCVEPDAHNHFGQSWTGSGAGIGVSVENQAVALGAVGFHGGLPNTPAHGYLGVEGTNDFAGIVDLDIGGREVGVLGTANDTGPGDNFGLYGFSNGVGLHAQGGILAGQFVGDVDVDGSLNVDKITYQVPRTHFYSVGDGDFHAGSGESYRTSAGAGGSYLAEAGDGWMVAGLHLPHGAVMTRFKVITDDGATGNLSVSLGRRAHTGVGFAFLASVLTAGTPGIQTLTDTTIANATIDNDIFAYHVRVHSVDWPGTAALKIKGVVVEYTVDEAI